MDERKIKRKNKKDCSNNGKTKVGYIYAPHDTAKVPRLISGKKKKKEYYYDKLAMNLNDSKTS